MFSSIRQLGIALGIAVCAAATTSFGTEISLKDGRTVRGKLAMLTTVGEMPKPSSPDGPGPVQSIILLDDDARRIFVPRRLVTEVRQEDQIDSREKFSLRQRVLRGGKTVKSVGPIVRVQPFDEFGRRILSMHAQQGVVEVIQAITELTPDWVKVEGVSHFWDMRMATSSLPRDVLHKILMKQINPKDIEQRKKVARFYIQAELYEDAGRELQGILQDFASDPSVKEQLEPTLRALRQLAAQRLLGELKLRRGAGQHRLVRQALGSFPSEGVAGEILQEVREMIAGYAALDARRKMILDKFDQLVSQIDDTAIRVQVKPIRDELQAELNINTLPRLAAFVQHLDDAEIKPAEKVALGASGWLVGSDAAIVKLPVALSLYRVRQVIREYLSEPIKLNRSAILGKMASEEGATPQYAAQLLENMKPPVDSEGADPKLPGQFALEVVALGKEPPVKYLVQLPPEYDPHRRYPTVLTLHGIGSDAAGQLDWWSGVRNEKGVRAGQGTRQGYIVIAPNWAAPHQKSYHYSLREHATVLACLRDACRRFSIDTDRVFLSGHCIGGDAVWDIGLAHPDLWAGVLPFTARSDKYCALYWENAQLLPMYFVCGELDGNRFMGNSRDLDRYLRHGYNVTVVEYQGRGHEDFYDEILRVFDWMGRFHRDFFPREFSAVTMRPWDNFFWWIEVSGMPSGAMVDPADWPPGRGVQPLQIKGSMTNTNGLFVRSGSSLVNVWLSPKLLDFNRRWQVTVNGRRFVPGGPGSDPSLEVLLEDARSRADRQHPFWAKVEMATGRSLEER